MCTRSNGKIVCGDEDEFVSSCKVSVVHVVIDQPDDAVRAIQYRAIPRAATWPRISAVIRASVQA